MGLPAYTLLSNSEYPRDYLRSESARDNLRGQKGNNPDRLLRPLKHAECERKLDSGDSQDVGLEAAIISKVRNSLLVENSSAVNDRE